MTRKNAPSGITFLAVHPKAVQPETLGVLLSYVSSASLAGA